MVIITQEALGPMMIILLTLLKKYGVCKTNTSKRVAGMVPFLPRGIDVDLLLDSRHELECEEQLVLFFSVGACIGTLCIACKFVVVRQVTRS